MTCDCGTENGGKYDFGIYSELEKVLPHAAKLLGVGKDDLEVLQEHAVPRSYMRNQKYCDRAVKAIGLLDIPFISLAPLHKATWWGPGDGLILYEGRYNPSIQYLVYKTTASSGAAVKYFIVQKSMVYGFIRHAHSQCKLASTKHPPILEDGLLESILNCSMGFLMRKKEIEKYGVKIRRGLILNGIPGNGKTMVCRWIQKCCIDAGIDYGTVTASEIDKNFHEGVSLDSLFSQYTVTFFDDIDIGYLSRKRGNGKMACAILTAMDGMNQEGHVIRVFTTNEELNDLDDAFIRPGRIDHCFTLGPPDAMLRKRLVLEVWPEEIVDYLVSSNLDEFIEKTEGFSFAEVEAVRTFLVTNKLFGDEGEWNLEKALEDYHESRQSIKESIKMRRQLGFREAEPEESSGKIGMAPAAKRKKIKTDWSTPK